MKPDPDLAHVICQAVFNSGISRPDILVINRGVHEPLEELVFQEMLNAPPPAPVMLELGAYWAHYSIFHVAETGAPARRAASG